MPARVTEADIKRFGRAAKKAVARQPAPVIDLDQLWRVERHYERRINGCFYHNIKLKPEEVVQFDVMNLLRRDLKDSMLAFHIANEAKRSRFAWAMQMAMGFLPGVADILAIGGPIGNIWIECKAPKMKPTAAQERFEIWCNMHGQHYILVTSAVEMQKIGVSWSMWK